ncbi:Membrane protein involved in the export of O-antigen and teichoic acid [Candidatus Frackibacter sp. WG12]|uniref:O-unit flippase-like protein n=1 Tax=Candidatus Frackibacter sp. WG12 TaxID=2017977 RepID=UPI0008C90EDE|nr:O-unit flippase-like protein [Candidatus Frackibacter sp. WG12]SEM38687.1 Membrane protein involved in the export of O-antigen and teichoic acid [Candidatus Frackibacter sp. WG12]
MEIKINNKDVVWSYFSQIFQFSAGIFLLPVILRKLPSEELDIWYVFLSISSLVNLLDFGFRQTIMRNVSYVFSGANKLVKTGINKEQKLSNEVNYNLLYSVIKTAKRIYKVIAILAFLLLITIGTWYIKDISTNINNQNNILIAWIIYVLSAVFNFYFYYYTPLLLGRGFIKESHKTIVFSKLFYIIFSFVGLTLNYGLIAVAVGNLLGSLVNRVTSYNYFYTNDIKSKFEKITKMKQSKSTLKLFKILWNNSYKLGLVSVGSFFILRANTLLASKFLNLEIVAQYGLSLQLLNVLKRSSSTLFNTYIPLFNQYRVKDNVSTLKKWFGTSLIIGWGTYLVGTVVIVFLGDKVLNLIGSETQLLPIKYLFFLAVILFLELNHSISATLITTKNEVPFVKSALLSGFGIAICSFMLLKFTSFGILGILTSQFIVQLSYNNWKWPLEILKDLKTNYKELFILGFKFSLQKVKTII